MGELGGPGPSSAGPQGGAAGIRQAASDRDPVFAEEQRQRPGLKSHVQTVLALREVAFWGQPAPNRAGSTRGAAGGSAGFPGGHV